MRILFPLPSHDYEPTETAVPWRALLDAGHEVVFATPDGQPARVDDRLLTGRGFGVFRPFLRAAPHARGLCAAMEATAGFQRPLRFDALRGADYDGLVLTGGHAPGMRTYLDDAGIHALTAEHLRAGKPVGAICHGVLVAARARDPETGRSVLHGRKTTCLLHSQEMTAFGLTRLWLGRYYRTYAQTVQQEVVAALAEPAHFVTGPFSIVREAPHRHGVGFVVRDGNYLSARFFADAYKFARVYVDMLAERAG